MTGIDRRVRILLLALPLAWLALKLQWARAIAWDEVEFFRAAKWIADGRVPFRDFWEHHLPLQWLLFAPFTTFAGSPGTAAIVAMRWAQVPLWIGIFALLLWMMRRAEIDRDAAWLGVVLLFAAPLFVDSAVEFRLDVPGALAFLGALAVVIRRPRSKAAWIAFGALMSAAVLANLRLAYLVAAAGAILPFADVEERRWRWNGVALWMLAGIALVVLAFGGWLVGVGAHDELLLAMRLNVAIDRILAAEARTLGPLLLRPFTTLDPAAIVLMLGGLAGAAIALRDARRPGVLQLLAILAILSLLFVARLGVHYPYHLQLTLLLFAPLVAALLRTDLARKAGLIAIAAIFAVQFAMLTRAGTFTAMRYQNAVMMEADRRTLPAERVWDGVGYALRREPAYRYWFLPSVVRIAAQRGMIPPYDAPQMIASPPAAIIHTERIHYWFRQFPAAAGYATHHYVPLYRDLWVPGLSATVSPSQRVQWIVPRDGRYRLIASDVLPKHPWFINPVGYPFLRETSDVGFEVELAQLPPVDRARIRLRVDGVEITGSEVDLKRGAVVTLESEASELIGVLMVPHDVTTLFISPDVPVIM
ncbi:MAG TPA: hypothetical protein VNA69_01135 [Thermoanaerobaculia bacterium]|nr:hypothetical protein [Thermoanaerobaculia bacterium]